MEEKKNRKSYFTLATCNKGKKKEQLKILDKKKN